VFFNLETEAMLEATSTPTSLQACQKPVDEANLPSEAADADALNTCPSRCANMGLDQAR
jgi:hypothetical protein